jgi:hypothetical protein
MGMKPGSTKSGKALFSTFFVGQAGTQYFVKPLEFEAEESNEAMDLDITFRYKKEIEGAAVVNMSFFLDKKIKEIDSLLISNGEKQLCIDSLNFMFAERMDDQYKCRFSSSCSLNTLVSLFEDEEWEIKRYNKGESYSYLVSKKTSKKLKKLDYELFEILR